MNCPCGKEIFFPQLKYCGASCRTAANYKKRAVCRRPDVIRKFGITVAEYEQLHAQQKGLCAICLRPETAHHHKGKKKHLAIDHDHISNKVRGLLCQRCNMIVGFIEANPFVLVDLNMYLGRSVSVKSSLRQQYTDEGFCSCGCGLHRDELATFPKGATIFTS
jgi:hypothetical protein